MIDALLQSDVTARLGMVLLHFVWQGFAIGALLAVCLAEMGTHANRAKYAAAVGAMLLLAVSPAVTWWVMPSSSPATAEIVTGMVAEPPESDAAGTQPEASASAGDVAAPFVPRKEASFQQRVRMFLSRLGGLVVSLSPWLALLWMLGAAVLSTNLIGGFLTLRRRRLGAALAATDLRHLCTALAKRMGTRVGVELRVSSRIDSPGTYGLFRPVILLPVSVATGHPVERLEMILAHELAHIQRHDYTVSVLQAVTETLLFYHPVVWWVSAVTRREREYICDSLALQATGAKRAEYVKTLLSLEEARPSLSLAASEAPLVARAKRILGAPPRSGMGFAIPLASAIILALLAALTAGLVLAQPNAATSSENLPPDDAIAEVLQRFDIEPPRFVFITTVGNVRWTTDVEGIGPERYPSFAEGALLVLEERGPDLSRKVHARRVGADQPEIEYKMRGQEESDLDEQALNELDEWIVDMLERATFPDPNTRATYDGTTLISVVRGSSSELLRENAVRHARAGAFNPILAAQVMQVRSGGFADDNFVARVIHEGINLLELELKNESPLHQPVLEDHIPWMLLTAHAVEDDALRLELQLEIAEFVSQTREEVSESVRVRFTTRRDASLDGTSPPIEMGLLSGPVLLTSPPLGAHVHG